MTSMMFSSNLQSLLKVTQWNFRSRRVIIFKNLLEPLPSGFLVVADINLISLIFVVAQTKGGIEWSDIISTQVIWAIKRVFG
jgi:hypothetical protein